MEKLSKYESTTVEHGCHALHDHVAQVPKTENTVCAPHSMRERQNNVHDVLCGMSKRMHSEFRMVAELT
eukprot:5014092-Amphidinium_carterae.1